MEWFGSQNQNSSKSSIQILQQTEQQVLKLLEIASNTCLELSKEDPDEELLSNQSEEYVQLIKNIKDSVANQILKMEMEVPYLNSSYGIRKDSEISSMKLEHILNQLNSMRSILGPIQPPLNSTPQAFSPPPSNSPMNLENSSHMLPSLDSMSNNPDDTFEDAMGGGFENGGQSNDGTEAMDEEFEDVELNIN